MFTTADLVILILVVLSALLAFARGFVAELLSISAWVGAGVATYFLLPVAEPPVADLIPHELGAKLAAGVGVFVISLVVLSILSHQVSRLVRRSALSAVDRSLGFLFGLLRGGALVALAFMLFSWFYPDPADHPDWVRDSVSYPWAEQAAAVIEDFLPADFVAAAAQAAPDGREQVEDVVDGVSTLQRLSIPQPAQPAPAPGPSDADREGLRRALEEPPGEPAPPNAP